VVDGVALTELMAATADVCGSLGVLLNGLRSHAGANFDAMESLEKVESRRRGPWALKNLAVATERVEATDRIEDWEGDVLRLFVKRLDVLETERGSSLGRSMAIGLGLSAIGGTLVDFA
jgi:hypothetical protein